jgi:hypothetical protein
MRYSLRLAMYCLGHIPLVASQAALGDEPRNATTTAKWSENQSHELIVTVGDLITPSQREIVNSGFSTFSLLAISTKKISEQDSLPEMRSICSVKYDTWEEKYQILKVEPSPSKTSTVKDYKAWAEECLSFPLRDQATLRQLSKGGTLHAVLQLRQSSQDEASRIKNWLVRQQSGFMQGLYAHMLGDFQFKGTVSITVNVPPAPIRASEDSHQKSNPDKKGI